MLFFFLLNLISLLILKGTEPHVEVTKGILIKMDVVFSNFHQIHVDIHLNNIQMLQESYTYMQNWQLTAYTYTFVKL